MNAERLLYERHQLSQSAFVELRICRVPRRFEGSAHDLKYALVLIVSGVCVLRYDNEAGKGDHRHLADRELPYRFTTPAQLLADFWRDVDDWRPA